MTVHYITTTEAANEMLDVLKACSEAAKDLDRERARPLIWMECTCCGEDYIGRQWWNQDESYGLGDCCVDLCGASREERSDTYGVPGIHYLIEKGGEV